MDKNLILNKLKDYKNIKTNKGFADFLGIKPTTLSMWYKRNTYDLELIFTKFEDLNADWLLTGKGEMLKKPLPQNEANQITNQYKKVPRIPIYAQAGFLAGYGDTEYMDSLPLELWEVDQEYKGNYLCFEVKGDSMDDNSVQAILEGDRLLCREVQRHLWKDKLHINKWNFVIAHKDQGILVKRITDHNTETGKITCHSLNNYYEDFVLDLNDVVALFNVVDLKRNLRF